MSDESTRKVEVSVEVEATLDEVWQAIAEGDGIAQWYVESAELEPKAGGAYRLRWSEGMDSGGRVDVFDPPNRLRLIPAPWSDKVAQLSQPLVEEYTLEQRGKSTVVRLVNSGIPQSEDWDDFFESIGRGWPLFFAALKQYVERHRGRRRRRVVAMPAVKVSFKDAWLVLLKDLGLDATPKRGEKTSMTLNVGGTEHRLEGEVLLSLAPYSLSVRIENADDSLLWFDFEGKEKESGYLYVDLSVFRTESPLSQALLAGIGSWADAFTARQANQ